LTLSYITQHFLHLVLETALQKKNQR